MNHSEYIKRRNEIAENTSLPPYDKAVAIDQLCLDVIGDGELQGMMTPLQWEVAQDRNALRQSQRKIVRGKDE